MNAVKEKTTEYFLPSPRTAVTSTGLTFVFICFIVFSFLVGTATSALFDLSANPGAKSTVDNYLSYDPASSFEEVFTAFLSIMRTDMILVILTFLFGLCVFPLIGLVPILFYRGVVTGIAAGITISSGYISSETIIPFLILSVAFILSFIALSLSASASFRFSAELRRTGFSPKQMVSCGMLKKYIYIAFINVGISAVSAGVQLLYYCIF